MKEIYLLFAGLLLVFVAAFSSHCRTTMPIGAWQCSRCGSITYVTSLNSHLPARNVHNGGHIHDWQYMGSLNNNDRSVK